MTGHLKPSPAFGMTSILDAEGEVSMLESGSTRVFDDPGSIWFILEGSMEFLAVQRRDGRQTGPNEHLFTISAGSLIWGIEQSTIDDGVHLYGVARTGVRLRRLSIETADRLAGSPATARAFSGALDDWIEGLARGATKYITPRKPPELALSPNEEVSVSRNNRITSRRGVAWVELADRAARHLDIHEAPSLMLPLSPRSWLFWQGEDCTLRGHATESVIRMEGFARNLDWFHRSVFHCLPYNFRNLKAMEDSRLRVQTRRTSGETEQILSGFNALLNTETIAHSHLTGEDALFACCTLVGRAIQVTMVMPPRAKQRRTEESSINIYDIATVSQLRVRQVLLQDKWWKEDNGPLVGFLQEDNRPVALLQKSPSRYVVHDPAGGREQEVTAEIARSLSSMACSFYPSLPDRALTMADLLWFGIGRCKADFFTLALTGALGGLIATGIPLATGYVIDSVIPGHQTSQMLQIGLGLVAAIFTATILRFASDIATLRIEGRIFGVLQAAFIDRLLRLPTTFFSAYSAGDLAQRTMALEAIRGTVSGVILGSLVSGVFSIFSFGLLFYYSPMAAGVASLMVAILAGVAGFAGLRYTKSVLRGQELAGRVNGRILEIISAITKLRLAGAEDRAFNLWGTDYVQMQRSHVASSKIAMAYGIFWSGYEILCLAAIFAVMAQMAGKELTTGGFLAFVAAFTGFLGSIGKLARSALSIFGVAPLVRRAARIVETVPETSNTKADCGVLTGGFEISQVTFRYAPNLPYILDGLSIHARPGEFVALVGTSGSGKSTVMRLLLGFERPESGSVFFDGRDLRGLNLQSVRRQIGVVLQNGRLMPASIYENIRGATHATLEECWEAAVMAKLDDDIRAMPMGMHTVLTEGSSSLSGGQVQRILIARAIVSKPRILLLDEATSALDNRSQAGVTESLNRLSVTRLVIAHRLTTVMNADRIYVLKDGQVVETGSYQKLLAQNGLFTELVERQQL